MSASTGTLWDEYGRALDASEKTRQTYARALRRYASWLETQGVGPLEATRETVVAYKRHLEASRSAATTNAYLVAVRSFYAWASAAGLCEDVAAGVAGVKARAHSSKDSLTPGQARALTAERHSATNELAALRDHAMLNLMVRRGLRTIEVSRADVGDLRNEGGRAVLWVQGKGHAAKDDFVVLGAECLGPIREYLAARGRVATDAPLFAATGNRNRGGRMTTRSISRIAKRAMAEQGMDSPRLTAHSLRHTAVTLSLMGGATVQQAQAMARHASIETTMIYAHNLDRLEARAETAVDAVIDGAAEHGPSTPEHRSEHKVSTRPTGVFRLIAGGRAQSEHASEHTASTSGTEALGVVGSR